MTDGAATTIAQFIMDIQRPRVLYNKVPWRANPVLNTSDRYQRTRKTQAQGLPTNPQAAVPWQNLLENVLLGSLSTLPEPLE